MSPWMVGDPHGNFQPLLNASAVHQPSAVILMGDCDLTTSLEHVLGELAERTWWIPGNHDGDSKQYYVNLFNSTLAERNLNGRVVEIEGVKIAGLGGVFRGQIWHPDSGVRYHAREDYLSQLRQRDRWRDGGMPLRRRVSIWPEDVERLRGQQADVLITHEAPSCHHHGFSVIDDIAEAMGVRLIVHGHHHKAYDATVCDGRVRVLGTALAGVRDLDGNVIAPGVYSNRAGRAYDQYDSYTLRGPR